MDAFYRLPYDLDTNAVRKMYDTISFRAEFSDGVLMVTIRNSGEKDIMLRSPGVHLRLARPAFYVEHGRRKLNLPLPGTLVVAAGEELHLSCPVSNLSADWLHVRFVSLVLAGEKVYEGLPERRVSISR